MVNVDCSRDAVSNARGDLLSCVPPECVSLMPSVNAAKGDIPAAVEIARKMGSRLPQPGAATAARWAALAALARADVTVARVTEAHTDALAVLAEAGLDRTQGDGLVPDPLTATWGVFAAEGGGDPVRATTTRDGRVLLRGHKPWCSLGGQLDAALITARCGDRRGLYRINLHDPGVLPQPASGWVSRGLPGVISVGLDLVDVPAEPVGEPDWYLTRAGFAWGGMGVAACWYGAAVGVADALAKARARDADEALLSLHRGRVDAALHAADCVLRDAAAVIDAGTADGPDGVRLALRVRAVVAGVAETVLHEVGHATGPAPLAFDEAHAARVADLIVYVRQHHGERDLAALGRELS